MSSGCGRNGACINATVSHEQARSIFLTAANCCRIDRLDNDEMEKDFGGATFLCDSSLLISWGCILELEVTDKWNTSSREASRDRRLQSISPSFVVTFICCNCRTAGKPESSVSSSSGMDASGGKSAFGAGRVGIDMTLRTEEGVMMGVGFVPVPLHLESVFPPAS